MVDILLIASFAGIAYLGWWRGMTLWLVAALAFLVAGLPCAAIAAALGSPPPAAAFVLGGMLGLIPVAVRLAVIEAAIEGVVGDSRWRLLDRSAGVVLNLALGAAIAWFVAAVVAIAPGETGAMAAIRASGVMTSLVEAVPPQGNLGAVVLRSGLAPAVNGPLVLAEPPEDSSAATPAVQAARGKVLEVRGTACGGIVTGTGWVAGHGVVVTNAHVVAGTPRSFLAGGPSYDGAPATVTAFDPVNDIAVLVLDPGPAELPEPLPIVTRVQHGERAAVIGYPRGGEQRVVPARIDRVANYDVEPLGGGEPRSVPVLAFRAAVQPGNSGGPVLAEDGSVLGLVVSKGLGQRIEAAYGVPSAQLLSIIADGARRQPVSTGDCLEDEELTRPTNADVR